MSLLAYDWAHGPFSRISCTDEPQGIMHAVECLLSRAFGASGSRASLPLLGPHFAAVRDVALS
jgi:hypothetical protein